MTHLKPVNVAFTITPFHDVLAGLTRFVLDAKEAGEGEVSGKTQVAYRSTDVKVRRTDTVQVIGNVRAVPQGPRGTFLTTRGIFSTVFAKKISREGKVLYASPVTDETDSQG